MSYEEFQGVENMVENVNEDENNNKYFPYDRFWERESSLGLNEQNYEDQAATSYHFWTSEKNGLMSDNFNSSKPESQVSETSCKNQILIKSTT